MVARISEVECRSRLRSFGLRIEHSIFFWLDGRPETLVVRATQKIRNQQRSGDRLRRAEMQHTCICIIAGAHAVKAEKTTNEQDGKICGKKYLVLQDGMCRVVERTKAYQTLSEGFQNISTSISINGVCRCTKPATRDEALLPVGSQAPRIEDFASGTCAAG